MSSISTALNSVFSLDRQRARFESQPVNGDDAEENATTNTTTNEGNERNDNSEEAANNNNTENNDNTRTSRRRRSSCSASSSRRRSQQRPASSGDGNNNATTSPESEEEEGMVEIPFGGGDEESTVSDTDDVFDVARLSGRNTMTLQELEEQRELSRRRSSACVLLAVFVLFRLWIECLQKQDPTLLLLCLLGTSWTARWIRYNREREEELDRRIENYLQNNNNNNGENGNNDNNGMDRNEFARLSFQAQLALAIMESQRHMMEGNFGRPDGDGEQSAGVTDEAKKRWKQFHWNAQPGGSDDGKKGAYGALPTKADAADNHCSICLSEYEDSEALTQLPCGHVYHDECIQSWTSNHTKCPLCNMDLESASHHDRDDSIV